MLLRWNDETPFVKFAVGEDERPVLIAELPIDDLDVDALGLAVARLLAVADRLHESATTWLKGGAWSTEAPRDATTARARGCWTGTPTQLGELLEPWTPAEPADAVDRDRRRRRRTSRRGARVTPVAGGVAAVAAGGSPSPCSSPSSWPGSRRAPGIAPGARRPPRPTPT